MDCAEYNKTRDMLMDDPVFSAHIEERAEAKCSIIRMKELELLLIILAKLWMILNFLFAHGYIHPGG